MDQKILPSFPAKVEEIDNSDRKETQVFFMEYAALLVNKTYQYTILNREEQMLWEDIWLSLYIYQNFEQIYKEVLDLIDPGAVKLKILKREKVHYTLANISYLYFLDLLDRIEKLEGRISAVQMLDTLGIDKLSMIKRYNSSYRSYSPTLAEELQAERDYWKNEREQDILSEKIYNILRHYVVTFSMLEKKEKDLFVRNLFYYCLHDMIGNALKELPDARVSYTGFTIIRTNTIPSKEVKTTLYTYLLYNGVYTSLNPEMSRIAKDYFNREYFYKELIEIVIVKPERLFNLKVLAGYAVKPGFTIEGIMGSSPVNTFSLGLFGYFYNVFDKAGDISLFMNIHVKYNSFNYESIFDNLFYTNAIARFDSYSVNFAAGISFIELNQKDILIFRPLGFYLNIGYQFFNQIDTRDYGNILLEDARQVVWGGGYYLDIELVDSLNVLLELQYKQYYNPISLDLNLVSYEIGPGIIFLFKII